MHDVAKIQNYQHVINTIDVPADWMAQLSTVLEARQNDDYTIQKLLKLMVDITTIDNISIAIPDQTVFRLSIARVKLKMGFIVLPYSILFVVHLNPVLFWLFEKVLSVLKPLIVKRCRHSILVIEIIAY
jgi:hypothetical protein